MNELVSINDKALSLKEFNNERVVTFKDIDFVHERPEGTAKRNFNENKKRFIEGTDYYFVKPKDIREYEIRTSEINNSGTYLITKMGYLMLVKSFIDDLAWQVQRQLVKSYFEGGILNSTIEARISAIEQRLGITEIFLIPNRIPLEIAFADAVNEALESGVYYLIKRGRHHQEIPEGKTLLGAYDGNYYYIISQRAYELYAFKQETPVIKKGLYAYLLNGGFIEPNTEKSRREGYTTQVIGIKHYNYHCLVFYADRISFKK